MTRLFPTPGGKQTPPADLPKTVVRRLAEAGNEPQTSSLATALGRGGDSVEIADTGPFFEDDCQIAGKSRLIRAKGGLRAMIKVDSTSNSVVKDQAAKFFLGGSKVDNLILEGLDIAVDVRDLPDHQTALFLCQGAELTLRDCSLTILNANDPTRTNRFSIFRVEEGAKPNRIILERTTIRGPIRTLVEVAAARAEVVIDRSLIVGDAGPLVSLEAAEKSARSVWFHRSLMATRGAVLEFSGKSSIAPVVRSLGSTFARVDGGTIAGPFASKAAIPGEPSSALDWSGEDNDFIGWAAWLTAGPESKVRVTGLDGVRTAWPNSDGSSRESPSPWPVGVLRDEVLPIEFAQLAADRKPTLARIASPHPRLKDLTIGSLARLPAPALSSTLIPQSMGSMSPPGARMEDELRNRAIAVPPPPPREPPQPNATGPRLKKVAPAPAKGAPAPKPILAVLPDLLFDVQDPAWSGDLGRFLATHVVEGVTRVTVRVRGTGSFATSPVRLPDGLSIAILGASIEGSKVAMPTFYAVPGAAGRSMIELHGGDLALANLGFATDGVNRPRNWVLVENGLLAIKHCRFRDPGAIAPYVGPVIAFVAKGAEPIAKRSGPFESATDRPTARLQNCLIWTGGDAISAELGRGVVDLENCLIISGGPAVSLWPQKVARDKFEADLVMENCTIATDKTGILLGPWLNDLGGPSRPWLVSTRHCVFPRTQTSGAGALLQVDPAAMARGALVWQSFADAYEGSRFLATTGTQPANLPVADLKKQWIDLWGQHHTRSDQGPNPRRNDPVVRYKDKDRPKPGKVNPGALDLDPKGQKDLGVDFKTLPPAPKA